MHFSLKQIDFAQLYSSVPRRREIRAAPRLTRALPVNAHGSLEGPRRPLVLHRDERRLHAARLEARRVEDHLLAGLLELLDVVADDALVLHVEHARLGPFAAVAELDVADHGLELGFADVSGE